MRSFLVLSFLNVATTFPSDDHRVEIYCKGPILDAVQRMHLFNDSKHFVDMSLKKDPELTLNAFHRLESNLSKEDLMKFVDEHFDPPGSELVECFPEDFQPSPMSFERIKDYHFRRWALQINRLWKLLCRQVKDVVKEHPQRYSLLYVPYPFIIPGGRFREFYYWDSYWIVKGLLVSEMYITARGIIMNLATMVENIGFVPNGGRIYYVTRSHPPLLTFMVYDYFVATGDEDFVREILPVLEKEYTFWITHRSKLLNGHADGGEPHTSFQYRATMKYPRPESYREDMETVHDITDDEEKERIWSNIASAAETGWDFSTRWFAHDGPFAYSLRSVRTWDILPVDLNAFMCRNVKLLSNLFEAAGDHEKSVLYSSYFRKAKRAMKELHWSEEDGIWFDRDVEHNRLVRHYYVSNALPLFASCYDDDDVPKRVHAYLDRMGVFNFTKGVPTSLIDSKQQWDYRNAWPPMVHMLIEGFRESGDPTVSKFARTLAKTWLRTNYHAFISTHAMFEKYNVSHDETSEKSASAFAGGGGEYEVQTGFGWTNGVILDLLAKYGDVLTSGGAVPSRPCSGVFLLSLLLLFALKCRR